MKRNLFLILFVLIIFAFNAPYAAAQNSIQVPAGNMVITAPSHFTTQKKPVYFDHDTHLKFSCLTCHHDWDMQGDITGCTASGCHEKLLPSPPSGKPTQKKSVRSITGAYHGACLGCHRDQKKQALSMKDNATAQAIPVECDGCHNDVYKDQDLSLTHFTLPLGTLTIEPPEEVYAKRAAVNFPHDLHFQQDCQVCHHDWYSSEEVVGCMASGCHDQFEPDESTRDINDPNNTLYFLAAYHNTCFKCHKESSDKDAVPPTKCDGCHNAE